MAESEEIVWESSHELSVQNLNLNVDSLDANLTEKALEITLADDTLADDTYIE